MRGLYVNPDFKEALRASEPFLCTLDDLVQAGERKILQEILQLACERLPQGFSNEEIQEWIDLEEQNTMIAHHCAVLLQALPDFDHRDAAAVEEMIETARNRAQGGKKMTAQKTEITVGDIFHGQVVGAPEAVPGGLYVHPMIKGTPMAPPLYDRLDDLVQAEEREVLEEILRWVYLEQGAPAEEADVEVAKLATEHAAVVAQAASLPLKYHPDVGRDDLAAINRVIEEARQRLNSQS